MKKDIQKILEDKSFNDSQSIVKKDKACSFFVYGKKGSSYFKKEKNKKLQATQEIF